MNKPTKPSEALKDAAALNIELWLQAVNQAEWQRQQALRELQEAAKRAVKEERTR